jgi:hypothetical protein
VHGVRMGNTVTQQGMGPLGGGMCSGVRILLVSDWTSVQWGRWAVGL